MKRVKKKKPPAGETPVEYVAIVDPTGKWSVKRASPSSTLGRKDDSGKPRVGLLPSRGLMEVAKVMTYGADKYGEYNWRGVEAPRYVDAIGRHYLQYLDDGRPDSDSGLSHLAHIAASCLILLDKAARDGD